MSIVINLLLHILQSKPIVDYESNWRIKRSTLYMTIAKIMSFRGTCNRGGRPGCVIVKDNRIVSTGYAGSPPYQDHCIDVGCDIKDNGCIATLHAEANAVAWAAREGISIKGATMYCTLSPCLFCAKIIVTSGIDCVWYLEKYRDISGIEYLEKCNISVIPFEDVDDNATLL